MALVIYEATLDEQCDRKAGEHSDVFLWQKQPLAIGDEVLMGSDRPWIVVKIDKYQDGSEFAYVATVNRADCSVPQENEWRSHQHLEFSERVSRYACMTPSRSFVSRGWMIDGTAPSGRLRNYYPTNHPTLQREEPSNWVVDQVGAFLPCQENSYSAIHLCWCKELAMTIAA